MINSFGIFHVLATNGHSRFGGSTFVDRLVNQCIGKKRNDKDLLCSVWQACEEGKKKLSTEQSCQIVVDSPEEIVVISLHDYNKMIEPYTVKTMSCVTNALSDADLEVDEINKIILVGGCTYTTLICDTLEQYFGKKVNRDINPMEAGKSLQIISFILLHIKSLNYLLQWHMVRAYKQQFLANKTDVQAFYVRNVTPLTIGLISSSALECPPLIKRNSAYPITKVVQGKMKRDYSKTAKIIVYEDEQVTQDANQIFPVNQTDA